MNGLTPSGRRFVTTSDVVCPPLTAFERLLSFSCTQPPQAMPPKLRVKSCTHCRLAKARCTQETPRSRCSQRHLDCFYIHHHAETARPATLRAIRSAAARPIAKPPSSKTAPEEAKKLDSLHHQTGDEYLPDASPEGLPSRTPDENHLSHSFFVLESEATKQDLSIGQTTQSQSLMPRVRMVADDSFTARMLISKIAEYLCMMAAGKNLPPFVHPPCALQSRNRPEDKQHTCLPDTLAVCASNLSAYYSPEHKGDLSAWPHIYGHVS
jgi:hypothetical protein